MESHKGHIVLLGAGPGDPELITLKGLKCLRQADVILYDALMSEELLDWNATAIKKFVGKRRGVPSKSQKEINELMLHYARCGAKVVRLKGGDPMVFGRAGTEILEAQREGIPIDVIPGISSFLGAAASQKIPLTQRGNSQSFWVVTGHTQDGKIPEDLRLAAQSSATVVVLMGMKFLKQIQKEFLAHKNLDYPVTVVQNATTRVERKLETTLEKLSSDVKAHGIDNPAVLIFGTHSFLKNKFSKSWNQWIHAE